MKVKLIRFLIMLLITTMSFSVLGKAEFYSANVTIENKSKVDLWVQFPEQTFDTCFVSASLQNISVADSEIVYDTEQDNVLMKPNEKIHLWIYAKCKFQEETTLDVQYTSRYTDDFTQRFTLKREDNCFGCPLGVSIEATGGESSNKAFKVDDVPYINGPDNASDISISLGIQNINPDWIVTNLSDDGKGSLRQAVDNAVDGDRIGFDLGRPIQRNDSIKLRSPIIITKSVTIDGPNDSINLVLQPANGITDELFNIGSNINVTIKNIDFSYAKNSAIINRGKLILDSCRFSTNYSDGDGGAICQTGNSNAELTINKCEYVCNTAKNGSGGAIYVGDGSIESINDSNFHDNNTTSFGGAFAYISGGDLPTLNIKNTNYF